MALKPVTLGGHALFSVEPRRIQPLCRECHSRVTGLAAPDHPPVPDLRGRQREIRFRCSRYPNRPKRSTSGYNFNESLFPRSSSIEGEWEMYFRPSGSSIVHGPFQWTDRERSRRNGSEVVHFSVSPGRSSLRGCYNFRALTVPCSRSSL